MTHGYGNPFTDHEKQQIQTLWATGMSASKIGNQLGRTKNSIIGIVRRMGLSQRQTVARKSYSPEAAQRRKEQSLGYRLEQAFSANPDIGSIADEFSLSVEHVKHTLWRRGIRTGATIQAVRVVRKGVLTFRRPKMDGFEMPQPTPINEGQGMSHQDLTPKHCQFPISESRPWRFCGCDRSESGPYCEGHRAITYRAYVPAEKPREFILEDRRAA